MKVTINGQSKLLIEDFALGRMEQVAQVGPDRYEVDLSQDVVLALVDIDPHVDTAIAMAAARYMGRPGNTDGPFLQ